MFISPSASVAGKRMERINVRLERDGATVLDDVEFLLHVRVGPSGLKSWSGSFATDLEHHFDFKDRTVQQYGDRVGASKAPASCDRALRERARAILYLLG